MIGKYPRMISAYSDLANQTPRLSLMVRLLVNSGTGGGGATKKFPGVPLFARFRSVHRIFAADEAFRRRPAEVCLGVPGVARF